MDEVLTPEQWKIISNDLKRKYPVLTDDDLPYYEAVENDMLYLIVHQLQKYHVDPGKVHFDHFPNYQ